MAPRSLLIIPVDQTMQPWRNIRVWVKPRSTVRQEVTSGLRAKKKGGGSQKRKSNRLKLRRRQPSTDVVLTYSVATTLYSA